MIFGRKSSEILLEARGLSRRFGGLLAVDNISFSLQKGENIAELFANLKEYLKEGPKFFPDDVITDQPERQIVSEFIREKALRLLNKEVPHGIAVEIERMKQRNNGTYEILAAIYCEKQSHKGIIIVS